MKTSLRWLNRYLDRPVDLAEAERLLTEAGFPLDGVESLEGLSGPADHRLDVEITSNRGDCLSHLGLAREIAARSQRQLLPPDIALPAAVGPEVASLTAVAVEDTQACSVYSVRVIRGVRVGPSPAWLQEHLEAAGLRPVNNVVDVTNFVLLESGQPLHAFDLGKLAGQRVVVRSARAGEAFQAIDGSKHQLKEGMLVVADAQKPAAVAGVMGGLASEVDEATTDLLLEAASFAPLSVRATSRALKLMSDSSFRFERGVDPRGIERASQRAAALILEVAGGELADGVLRVGADQPQPLQLSLRPQRCRDLLGVAIADDCQVALLVALGLDARLADGKILVSVPTFRLDLRREVDLIEEIARMHGLEKIPVSDQIAVTVRSEQEPVRARRVLSEVLVAHGYHETITFSFVGAAQGEAFVGSGAAAVQIGDERRKAEPMLRPSLWPSLLACRKSNQDAGNSSVRLFESAATWQSVGGQIREHVRLGLLRDAEGAVPDALRSMRGTVETLIQTLGGAEAAGRLRFEPQTEPAAGCEISAQVWLGDAELGVMGVLAPQAQQLFDLQMPVVLAELQVADLLALYPPHRRVQALPRFPAIERDLSLLVDETVPWQTIEAAIATAEPALLESVRFLGTYRGKPIPAGRKSVSLRMLFRDAVGTLRHDQVDPQVAAVLEVLRQSVGAELRG